MQVMADIGHALHFSLSELLGLTIEELMGFHNEAERLN
ncbi:P2 GpE family protein [Maridesulfovibrio hydrothermalis AM13 = DSM 14728]|uniref:p2 GpE family protein n=1 Tax=Maridesulfovibrio hydrothermalis AM13 = DSM 14728 TaxID=1121451 RepID=L0R9G7_9BACT|nr:P2 GpE family protein [Maridesulfovibrio hydrothermalis AM13 = DSM 14728]